MMSPDDVVEWVEPSDIETSGSLKLKLAMASRPRKNAVWDHNTILRRLRGEPKSSKRIVTFDYETTPISISNGGDVRPYILGLYYFADGEEKTEFFDDMDPEEDDAPFTERFLRRVLTPDFNGANIYAHNGGKFDFKFLLYEFLDNPAWREAGFRMRFMRVQSCVLAITVYNIIDEKAEWTFLDSYRLVPYKLDDIGKAFTGEGKLDAAKELGCKRGEVYREMCKRRNRQIARKYCGIDCKRLYQGIDTVQTLVNMLGGEIRATTASTAKDVWQRAFLEYDINTNRHFLTGPDKCPDLGKEAVTCSGCAHHVFRTAFYGGRTEEFRTKAGGIVPKELRGVPSDRQHMHRWRGHSGKIHEHRSGRVYYYDVKSHYPNQMLQPMPTGPVQIGALPVEPAEVLRFACRGKVGFVHATVLIPDDCEIPPLPVRIDPRTNRVLDDADMKKLMEGSHVPMKLIFPRGTVTGIWAAPEIALIAEIPGAKLLAVHAHYWFAAKPIFASFIRRMYELKEGPDKGLAKLAKLLMNSLFGKTGQKEMRSLYHVSPTTDFILGRGALMERLIPDDMACDVWVEGTWKENDFVTPQIAAYVTALGRAYLWRLLCKARERGAHVYYCDTDSLIVDLPIFDEGSALGELELQHVGTSMRFVLPKFYDCRCHADCPGRPKGECTTIGMRKNRGMPKMGRRKWMQVAYQGVAISSTRVVSIMEGVETYFKTGEQLPVAVRVEKRSNHVYDKRYIVRNGIDTIPLTIFDGHAYPNAEAYEAARDSGGLSPGWRGFSRRQGGGPCRESSGPSSRKTQEKRAQQPKLPPVGAS